MKPPDQIKKVLVVRMSSIGDIVLTTPIIRSLKQARPDIELHYLTRAAYGDILAHNPHVDRLHLAQHSPRELSAALRSERFDYVLDLHNNARSLRILLNLRRPFRRFPKHNFAKLRMTMFKQSVHIPHVVERYAAALKPLNIPLDDGGLDFFLPDDARERARTLLSERFGTDRGAGAGNNGSGILAVVLGAKHRTKIWVPEHFRALLKLRNRPAILLGGPDDRPMADEILASLQTSAREKLLDAVGRTDLGTSAALLEHGDVVLSHDTGLMHIAAALQKKTVTLWGNTIPGFGMTPYRAPHRILEVNGLGCRPCSKIGYDRCPQGHFRCMREITPEMVATALETI